MSLISSIDILLEGKLNQLYSTRNKGQQFRITCKNVRLGRLPDVVASFDFGYGLRMLENIEKEKERERKLTYPT